MGRPRADVAADLWARGYPVFGAAVLAPAAPPQPPLPLPPALAAAEHLFEPGAWVVPPAVVCGAAVTPPALASAAPLPVVRLALPPQAVPLARAYAYLLDVPLGQVTSDAMARSGAAAAALRRRLDVVAASSPWDEWLADLSALEQGLQELDGAALGAGVTPTRR